MEALFCDLQSLLAKGELLNAKSRGDRMRSETNGGGEIGRNLARAGQDNK